MTSVVNTSVKYFHSSMIGAPILNGVAGSLISVLNACLVNGFDTKSATSLVVLSGVATLSFTGSHSAAVDSVILISGSSIEGLNGEQKVTAISAGVVKFATAEADATATGTITFKMAPAGWTQPFVGTNLATYKSADPASTGMYLRVDDTAALTARVVGYETMSDINTGVGPFPTPAQLAAGGYWHKSSVANVNPALWVIISDGRKIIFHNAASSPASGSTRSGATWGFGDDLPMRPGGDPYACSLGYGGTSDYTAIGGALDYNNTLQQAMPRSYTGLGTCVLHALIPYTGSVSSTSGMDTTLGSYPSIVDGGLRLVRKAFITAASSQPPRSDLPGLYHVPSSLAYDTFKTLNIISGTGPLTGRNLIALNPSSTMGSLPSSSNTGVSFVDITGPWR